jgi:hypothetical protein
MNASLGFDSARIDGPAEWSGLESLEARTLMSAAPLNTAGGSKVKILNASAAEGSAASPGKINFLVKRLGDVSAKSVVKFRTIALSSVDAAVLGADLQAAFGKLVFKPGQKNQTITVNLIGNDLAQDSRRFGVELFKPKNTKLAKSVGVGTIADDDGNTPALTINDISVVEGNSGTKTVFFTVKLSKVSNQVVTVKYATKDGSATSNFNPLQNGPEDYIPVSGTLTFQPGETTKTIAVQIVGDTIPAKKLFEVFYMNLSAATNATIAKAVGEATIEDND